jgi:hypothetical protein
MIYDKNRFLVNIILSVLVLLIIILSFNLLYNTKRIENNLQNISLHVNELYNRQYFQNYIQASHNNLNYMLTTEGFFIKNVNDFGKIEGPSMQPGLFDNYTLLEIKYAPGMELKNGQIIRYMNSENVGVIHRIRAVYTDNVHVQGDNLPTGELVDKRRITHIVVGVIYT